MEGQRRMVRNERGQEVVSDWTLYFPGSVAVAMTTKDRLTLPDGRRPPIISVSPRYDEKGNVDHVEVNL